MYTGGRKLISEQLAGSNGSYIRFSGRTPYLLKLYPLFRPLKYFKTFTSLFGLLRFFLSYSHGSVPQRRHRRNVFLGKWRVGMQGHNIFLMSILLRKLVENAPERLIYS